MIHRPSPRRCVDRVFVGILPGRRVPHAVPAAHARLADQSLRARVEVVAGDFFEAVPAGDLYVLSMILHDWDDEACARILRSIASAARPGARLISLELVVPPGVAPHASTMIDLTMLGMLTGRERGEAELPALFASVGMRLDRVVGSPRPIRSSR
jgi:hypothetical protein